MNFRQFAFNNVIRNKRTYIAHFLSSAFAVMIFFVYALLLFHPDLQGELASTSGTMSMLASIGMRISQYIVFIFSFFFLLYSVSAFLKLRKREFGILMLLGMSKRQLHKLLFIENILIGFGSILTGIAAGLIFSKLILLVCANLLAIERGLRFYIPLQAIWLTAAAFAVMFVVISLFTSLMVRKVELVELIKSSDKPKPEPKASWQLALLAVLLIAAGYGCVFYFVLMQVFSLGLLAAGVGLVILGTYFLFTQLSVYVIRMLKRNKSLFLRRTNLLTFSELAYRMKDNAIMFFMVSIISAVAFTGIGTCLAIGAPGLAEMTNPYSFRYSSYYGNTQEQEHVRLIQQELTKGGFPYQMGTVSPGNTDNDLTLIKLSDYNSLAKALGHPAEQLRDQEAILAPATVTQAKAYKRDGIPELEFQAIWKEYSGTFKVLKSLDYVLLPDSGNLYIVTDKAFKTIFAKQIQENINKAYHFVVKDWQKSREVSNHLKKLLPEDFEHYTFSSLVDSWIKARQINGILFILSGLVGIVFFTFAASFIYFRLYADSERDEEQYKMIAKVGLSRKELNKTVTRQLSLMFFLPIVLAMIHSAVAMTALQQLITYSVFEYAIAIFASFLFIQIVYFLITRSRYLRQLYRKLI
ncbi:ABC transporter permease [Paenibacillus sp. YPG26]|uniref:ABC transporter permease n=1 Tax=Paenibacillus sp. YPG26 TaxID=2878915 RepID=UPI00204183AA|nr:ABC transporter permease [Paenibacillus sp. YPG26]USB34345.1 ABC transporter permease [Paenibacillus sp. YPG26]